MLHAGNAAIHVKGQRVVWERTRHTDGSDTYERNGYRIDVFYSRGDRAGIKSATLANWVGTNRQARLSDGHLCETVIDWMDDPRQYVKPPLGERQI